LVGAKIQLFSYNSLKSEENILILLSICDIHKKVKPIINFCLTLAKKAAPFSIFCTIFANGFRNDAVSK